MSEELRLRIASGIVMAVVVLAATWYGGLAFRLLSAAIALLVYYEWSKITKLASGDLVTGWVMLAVLAATIVFASPGVALVVLGFGLIIAFVRAIASETAAVWLPAGLSYAGFSGISIAAIRGDDAAGFAAMLFVFALVWTTDILAYFVGRAIGGPKLAPRISPGKTWSGAIGGTIFAVGVGTAVALYLTDASPTWVVPVALVLSVASQAGDLFESFIKRRFGVKDSSHLIPGHGGVMDRVDGLVVACFAAFLLMALAATTQSGLNGTALLGP